MTEILFTGMFLVMLACSQMKTTTRPYTIKTHDAAIHSNAELDEV